MTKPLYALSAAALVAVASPVFATPTISASTGASVTVAENVGSLTITFTKDTVGTTYSEIWVSTRAGTAIAGTDYTYLNHNVDFDNKEMSRTVTIPITNRAGTQGNRSFTVFLKSQRYATLPVTSITVTIADYAPPPPAWVSAPITEGGYVRCKRVGGCISDTYPCPQGLNPPAVCHDPDIVAQQGDVYVYRWGGKMGDNFVWETIVGPTLGDFWPIGHDPKVTKLASDWYLGFEAPITLNDWEGVTPAAPTTQVSRLGLVYNVVSQKPDTVTGTDTIVGVRFDHDTTGKYYLANDTTLKQETQYFFASDLKPVP